MLILLEFAIVVGRELKNVKYWLEYQENELEEVLK